MISFDWSGEKWAKKKKKQLPPGWWWENTPATVKDLGPFNENIQNAGILTGIDKKKKPFIFQVL